MLDAGYVIIGNQSKHHIDFVIEDHEVSIEVAIENKITKLAVTWAAYSEFSLG